VRPARGGPRADAASSPKVSRATILAVDDEPDVLTILQWFLSSEGFEVMTALSGPEALQRVEERLPDLIITDYRMPGMSGLALCRWLRAHRETQGIPIILHTAQDPPPTDRLYDRVFTKPSDIGPLVSEVRALLAHSR